MTTFQSPLKTVGANGITGNSQTETTGFVHSTKIVSLGGGSTAPRSIITLPPKSVVTGLYALSTSAFAADVSAVNVNFGNSAQASRYGVISVSALGLVRNAAVSAATDFDAGGTMVITGSAVGTTTFTTGGFRAFVEYITVE
jgi:hypothetical protein